MTRWARKRDLSEPTIVEALQAAGCDVERGTDCDLYVAFRGKSWLMECKSSGPNAKRRQPIQKRLAEIFGSQYVVIETPRDALLAIGAIAI